MTKSLQQFSTYEVPRGEQDVLRKAIDDRRGLSIPLLSDEFISDITALSTTLSQQLPGLVSALGPMLDEASSPGLLVLENLPDVGEVRDAFGLIVLVGSLLGNVVKYDGEGPYVIEIKNQGTKAGERPSFSNSREFFLHTDLSYVDIPPRFFLLHSLANDPSGGGYSSFCHISTAVNGLATLAVVELGKPQFEFPAPPHFRGAQFVRHPILTREEGTLPWRIRFRRDNLRSINRPGIDALVELIKALKQETFETTLLPNQIAVIDNWSLLHGRTAYAPQPLPRHINRTYVNPRTKL